MVASQDPCVDQLNGLWLNSEGTIHSMSIDHELAVVGAENGKCPESVTDPDNGL